MPSQQKILLLDDDVQMLDIYQELLKQLPSRPEVHVSNSGARAIALLESEPFTVLITDLRMPKMDGLQVLAIVRRRFPALRIVVLTGLMDEEYRSRAYAQGVELYWQKPSSPEEVKLFQDCIESLLGRDPAAAGSFRGMQSKSLVDLIQLECLSHSSSVLQVHQGALEGKIWLQQGEITDAATSQFAGEEAFREILGWKSGNFQILPGEPARPRRINHSSQALLLDSAQALDEWRGQLSGVEEAGAVSAGSPLAPLAKFEGVEFVLTIPSAAHGKPQSWALENPSQAAAWAAATHRRLNTLGEKIGAGELGTTFGYGLQGHWALVREEGKGLLCVGFRRGLTPAKVSASMKDVFSRWVS